MPKTQADHQTWSLDASSAAVGRAWRVLAVLSALLGFASISTDFYLPAVPAMATALHASHGMLEFSITGYLIGFSIGQLFWGPVSDKFGRRLPADAGQFFGCWSHCAPDSGLCGRGWLLFAGMFAYIAGTPFAYITYHLLPAEYCGWFFGAGILGVMATNVLNARLVTRFAVDRLLVAGALIAAVASIACAVVAWTDWGIMGSATAVVRLHFLHRPNRRRLVGRCTC